MADETERNVNSNEASGIVNGRKSNNNNNGSVRGNNDKKEKRRSRIWFDKKQTDSQPSSAPNSAPPSPPGTPTTASPVSPVDPLGETSTETIPTAIVIKNIPFSLKRDALLGILNAIDIPRPYAFNYHFDNGVFRGLAFANYRTPEDTDAVVAALNGFEVAGRKLRVEYKRVLPGSQDKEKEERKCPTEEKRDVDFIKKDGPPQFKDGASNNDRPQNLKKKEGSLERRDTLSKKENDTSSRQDIRSIEANGTSDALDLNNPETLKFYDQLILFRGDIARDEFVFPKTLGTAQRRAIHLISEKLNLYHYSDGEGEDRQLHIVKRPASAATIRGETPSRVLSHRSSRNSLRSSPSRERLRDSDSTSKRGSSMDGSESPTRSLYRKSLIGLSSALTDNNTVYPVRQPRGPEPGKNFASRLDKRPDDSDPRSLRRQTSNLNLFAPAFQPTAA
ncbi:hypothetical protein BC936DRAFT_142718 [Jimgerdemannia flammicorona]|uniref:RRM domain-containing protein n=1 Tax=Jimgerdemannia flammicorona TaxID=994334 RepID=A0A432ZZX1_9FUNG|nr:hypothetical protein BC936DRAFT_142718 [Jimgerdemannia flammicorona]